MCTGRACVPDGRVYRAGRPGDRDVVARAVLAPAGLVSDLPAVGHPRPDEGVTGRVAHEPVREELTPVLGQHVPEDEAPQVGAQCARGAGVPDVAGDRLVQFGLPSVDVRRPVAQLAECGLEFGGTAEFLQEKVRGGVVAVAHGGVGEGADRHALVHVLRGDRRVPGAFHVLGTVGDRVVEPGVRGALQHDSGEERLERRGVGEPFVRPVGHRPAGSGVEHVHPEPGVEPALDVGEGLGSPLAGRGRRGRAGRRGRDGGGGGRGGRFGAVPGAPAQQGRDQQDRGGEGGGRGDDARPASEEGHDPQPAVAHACGQSRQRPTPDFGPEALMARVPRAPHDELRTP